MQILHVEHRKEDAVEVTYIHNDQLPDVQIQIHAASLDETVQNLMQYISRFENSSTDRLIGTQESNVRIIPLDEIIRISTEGRRVIAITTQGTWSLSQRLYELEESLPHNQFVKINQGEIINLSYVRHMDLSRTGTIAVVFTNGETSFVSRRQLKRFREALNI